MAKKFLPAASIANLLLDARIVALISTLLLNSQKMAKNGLATFARTLTTLSNTTTRQPTRMAIETI